MPIVLGIENDFVLRASCTYEVAAFFLSRFGQILYLQGGFTLFTITVIEVSLFVLSEYQSDNSTILISLTRSYRT